MKTMQHGDTETLRETIPCPAPSSPPAALTTLRTPLAALAAAIWGGDAAPVHQVVTASPEALSWLHDDDAAAPAKVAA